MVLADILRKETGAKVRAIELSLMQRCATHCASQTDIDESFMTGQTAVLKAIEGLTDYMIGFERAPGKAYKCNIEMIPLNDVANTEKKVPRDWINPAGNFVTEQFVEYALPLIQNETQQQIVDGLPRFAKLKKILVQQ
jgi:6-phosphofructokinase 1